jgi:hypothetical protein
MKAVGILKVDIVLNQQNFGKAETQNQIFKTNTIRNLNNTVWH